MKKEEEVKEFCEEWIAYVIAIFWITFVLGFGFYMRSLQ